MPHFRSFNRYLLISMAMLGMSVSYANAASVSGLQNVDIGGTLYDVTFHSNLSFYELWDGNIDGNFEPDGSVFDGAPTFWGDELLAESAATAVMSKLGVFDTVLDSAGDGFAVPYAHKDSSSIGLVKIWFEYYPHLGADLLFYDTRYYFTGSSDVPYASFAVSAVPVPAAVWLFGTALIGLVGFSKRKSGIVT
jgi:hypothetical protein